MSPRFAAHRVAALVVAAILGPFAGSGIASTFDPGAVSMSWDIETEFALTTVLGPGDLPMSMRRELGPSVALPARGVDMVVEDTCGEGAVAYTDGLVCLGLVDGLDVSEGAAPLKAAKDQPDLVPEPATVSLLLTGMGLLVTRRRRVRRDSR
jgi:hypothetical protein